MAKDRARDTRRSVGSFEKMKGALGKAAGWTRHTDPELGAYAIKADEQGNAKFPANYRVGKDATFPIGRSSATRYNSVAAIERSLGGQPSEPEKRAVENKNKMMKGPSDPSVVKINTNPVK